MSDKWDRSICKSFTDQAAPRLQDRIGSVASNHKYVIFGELHNDTTSLSTLAQPETLSALKCAGHNTIASELFHVGQNQIFDAYFNDEISDQTMQYYITNTPTNLEGDMDTDPKESLEKYWQIIKNAKEHDIHFKGVSTLSGIMDRETIIPIMQNLGNQDLQFIKALDQNPDFYKVSREQQSDYIQRLGEYFGLTKDEITQKQVQFGDLAIEENSLDPDAQMIIDRFNADPLQAQTIQDVSVEGGTTVIYGGLHVWRLFGDLDASLGEEQTAVISTFKNSKEFWQETLPAMQNGLREIDINYNLENVGNYQFDAKTNTWYDSTNDTNTIVEIPDGMKETALPTPLKPLIQLTPLQP